MMNYLVAALAFIYVVSIDARPLDADSADDADDSIENIIVKGDETRFSAIVIMKPPTKTEEKNSKPNEVPYNIQDKNDLSNIDAQQYGGKEEDDVLPIRFLRRKPWQSCHKSISKLCKKACFSAYKDMCSYNKCKSRMKKSMKKECKRSCKSYIEGDDDYSNESEE